MNAEPPDEKTAALRRHHALNPRPQDVSDPAFSDRGDTFFDARDIVQVKYEMLRRVRHDGEPVNRTAEAFGFSRPSYYQAQAAFADAGLAGLLPRRPGPKEGHKLSSQVLEALEKALAAEPGLTSAQLAELVLERFRIRVHKRSVERALARRKEAPRSP